MHRVMPTMESTTEPITTGQMSDEQVVARALAGEPALFELIMRRHNRRLFRIARSILCDDAEAEDAVQEGYVRAWFRLVQFRGPGGFPSWLARIVTNEALMRRRAIRRHLSLATSGGDSTEDSHMVEPHSTGADPETALRRTELRRLLEAAIDGLPDAYRTAFVLSQVEQMPAAEVAACLEIEPATVNTRVYRARRLLRQRLGADLNDMLGMVFDFDGPRCDRLVRAVLPRIGGI